jgi:nucleoside-diphosphate-sugar epimerase
MRVLVVGGTGWLGPFVVDHLRRSGHDVTIFHRGVHEHPSVADFPHVHAHRLNREHLSAAVTSHDAVVDTHPTNDDHARCLADACRGRVQRSVHVVCANAYLARLAYANRVVQALPFHEDSELREKRDESIGDGQIQPEIELTDGADEPVALDRALREELRRGELPMCVLRVPKLYGPNDRHYGVEYTYFVRRILDGRPLLVSCPDWLVHFAYVEDVASAVLLALESPQAMGELFNVGEPEVSTIEQRFQEYAAALDRPASSALVPSQFLPSHLQPFEEVLQHHMLDTTKIRRMLGYQEKLDRAERFRRTVESYLRTPILNSAAEIGEAEYRREDEAIAEWAALQPSGEG